MSLPSQPHLFTETDLVHRLAVQKNQKAVSRWYDQNPGTSTFDVYQPEWRDRLLSWYIASTLVGHLTRVSDIASSGTLNDLDWVGFASKDPVAAVGLWKLLQAAYQLDNVICQKSQESEPAVSEWQDLKPFEYLGSAEVQKRWTESLESMRAQFEAFEDEDAFVHRMCEMRYAVEALEDAWKELETSWDVNLKVYPAKDLMLTRIRHNVTWRFSALNSAIKGEFNSLEEQGSEVTPTKDSKKRPLRNSSIKDKGRKRSRIGSTAPKRLSQ